MGRVFIILALSLPLWIFDPTGGLTFRTVQWGALFIVSAAVLFACRRTMRPDPWLFIGFVPVLVSFAFYRNGESLVALGAWAAFAAFVQLRRSDEQLFGLAQEAVVIGAGLNLALLFLQVLGFDPLFQIPEQVSVARLKTAGTAGLTGFAGGAADVAIFLVLAMPVVEKFFASRPRVRWVALALLLAGITITGSRLPLALAIGFVTWRLPGRWRWVVPAVLVILVLAYPQLRQKTLGAMEQGRFAEQVSRRTTEWGVAARLFMAQPFLPQGYGHYGMLEADYRFEHGLPAGQYHGWFAQAHNDFLQTAVEVGAVGIVAFALALFPVLLGVRQTRVPAWSLVLFVPLMLFHFPVRLAPAVFALAVGLQLPPRSESRPRRWQRWSTGATLAALLCGALVIGLDWAAANQWFRPGPSLLRLLPVSRTRLTMQEAQAHAVAGRTAEAEVAWQKVLDEQPYPQAASFLAANLLARGEVAPAVTTVCRTYVVTGYPPLGAWLREHRAHVINLAAADKRLAVCAEP